MLFVIKQSDKTHNQLDELQTIKKMLCLNQCNDMLHTVNQTETVDS
jgi:hypothetical protein